MSRLHKHNPESIGHAMLPVMKKSKKCHMQSCAVRKLKISIRNSFCTIVVPKIKDKGRASEV